MSAANVEQEGYLSQYAVKDEDRNAAQPRNANSNDRSEDPMQGLDGLDVAGPKQG